MRATQKKSRILWVALTAGLLAAAAGLGIGAAKNVVSSQASQAMNDPLVKEVRAAFARDIQMETVTGVPLFGKPRPGFVEISLSPQVSGEAAVATTRSLPALEQWQELPECSSDLLWCAVRTGKGASTLLATWSYEAGEASDKFLIFRISEN